MLQRVQHWLDNLDEVETKTLDALSAHLKETPDNTKAYLKAKAEKNNNLVYFISHVSFSLMLITQVEVIISLFPLFVGMMIPTFERFFLQLSPYFFFANVFLNQVLVITFIHDYKGKKGTKYFARVSLIIRFLAFVASVPLSSYITVWWLSMGYYLLVVFSNLFLPIPFYFVK